MIISCGECGQKNRLPVTVAHGQAVVCGRCKVELLDWEDEVEVREPDDDEDVRRDS